MKPVIRYAGLTDRGRVRQTNEDNWTADPELGLFVVADGMGGEAAGELASRIVVATLPRLVRQALDPGSNPPGTGTRRRMGEALATLSRQLRQQTENEPGLDGMGSTVVCVLLRDNEAILAHLGDSRAYRLRRGQLKRLTRDHSLVQLLLDSGDISPDEVAMHPARGRLTRSVGMQGEPLPETRSLKLEPGDQLLLCTDGLTGMLEDRQIHTLLEATGSLPAQCERLVAAANQAGGKDNVTVLLIAVSDAGGRDGER
ncbi:MAG: Stp1/IreP family PP2C-type Ser/Thr phosphatase [Verrucomicrobia bacterium]|nr:Stp1/IreP family PP2C-type Ser/Thr phosphatase [Verrucomicrobiota bacterium]